MSDRLSTISADVDAARAVYLSRPVDEAGFRVSRLDFEEDSVSFEVTGFEGDFTAFLADPYPGGQTTVYGPDDLEFEHSGTVSQVLAGVLEELAALRRRRGTGDSVTSDCDRAESGQEEPELDGEDDDDAVGHDLDAANWILEESPIEPRLQRDIESVRARYGTDSVACAQLSVECWRLRLRVPLRAASESLGVIGGVLAAALPSGWRHPENLVDETTANAWGMHPTNPLVLELLLPTSGYMASDMPPTVVKAVWQENHPKFALEKQIMQILTDFCADVMGIPLPSATAYDEEDHSEEELATMRKYEEKKVTMIADARKNDNIGFLVHLMHYAQLRVPTIHEYCAICDQPFVVAPMMLRTVCCRSLCTYQFGEFGDKITTAEGVNTQAEIVDLLVCMLMRAALSARRDLILDPYPCVYGGIDGRERYFDPRAKDFDKLQETLKVILKLRQECAQSMGAAWSALRSRMTMEAAALVKWVVASNRSFLAPLQEDEQIVDFQTPFQYLLISAPPDRERRFQELKRKHGSTFAYHGSSAENWHSILRNGLKNATNTRLMTSGAAHGPGIYLSTEILLSMNYSLRQHGSKGASVSDNRDLLQDTLKAAKVEAMPDIKRQKTGNRFVERVEAMAIVAVCEVIEHPTLKRQERIWVAASEEHVITRFLLVFPDYSRIANVNISTLVGQVNACMQKLRVGQPVGGSQ